MAESDGIDAILSLDLGPTSGLYTAKARWFLAGCRDQQLAQDLATHFRESVQQARLSQARDPERWAFGALLEQASIRGYIRPLPDSTEAHR